MNRKLLRLFFEGIRIEISAPFVNASTKWLEAAEDQFIYYAPGTLGYEIGNIYSAWADLLWEIALAVMGNPVEDI